MGKLKSSQRKEENGKLINNWMSWSPVLLLSLSPFSPPIWTSGLCKESLDKSHNFDKRSSRRTWEGKKESLCPAGRAWIKNDAKGMKCLREQTVTRRGWIELDSKSVLVLQKRRIIGAHSWHGVELA